MKKNMNNGSDNVHAYVSPQLSEISEQSTENDFFTNYFEKMLSAVVYGKILYRNGKPNDFVFLYTNPALKHQIGLSPKKGQRVSEIVPGICESDPEMFARQGCIAAGAPPEQYEIYIKALNEWFSAQIFSPKPDHFCVIFEKITQRVLTAQHLERVLGEQKAILDSHVVGIAKIRDRKFIWSNNAFETLLGYTDSELIGKSTRVCYPTDEDFIEFGKIALAVLSQHNVFRAEHQLVTKDGSLRWFSFHAELLEPDKLDYLMILIDINEQKETHNKLLETRAELQDLYDNAPCGYHSFDGDGTYRKINATELAWLGCTREDVVGKMKPTDFFTPDSKETFARLFPQLKTTGRIENIQIELISKSGTKKNVSVSATIIKDANDNFLGTRSIMYDKTRTKELEDQIRQLAFYDSLTHLPNRHLFEDRLTQTLSASGRNHCYGALLFLDLDNFKPLNDRHGHSMGDLLLIEVAQRLKKCVREIDTVARFGGDEFVVIISELSTDKAESTKRVMKIAKKINRALNKPYRLTQEQEGKVSMCVEHVCPASIGITVFMDHTTTQAELVRQADSTMYLAKSKGKNTICFYTEKSDNKSILDKFSPTPRLEN